MMLFTVTLPPYRLVHLGTFPWGLMPGDVTSSYLKTTLDPTLSFLPCDLVSSAILFLFHQLFSHCAYLFRTITVIFIFFCSWTSTWFSECLPKQLQTLSHSVTDISLFIKCNDLGNPQFLPLSSREISGTWITQPDIIRANVWICPICPYHFCSVL